MAKRAAAKKQDGQSSDDEKILQLARECKAEAEEYWQDYLNESNDWAKFLAGEQWPDDLRTARQNDKNGARPCLTLDRLGQYVRQVQNDARQNRPAIQVKPVNSLGSVQTARIYQDYIRQIEHVSRAPLAYGHALKHSSAIGLGWFRLVPVVVDESRNVQELRIKRVHNPRAVLSDPDWSEPDGSDLSYVFVLQNMPVKRFQRDYPGVDTDGWEQTFPTWVKRDTILIAEFLYVCDGKEDYVVLQGGEMMPAKSYNTIYGEQENRPQVSGEAKDIKTKHVDWLTLTAGAVLDRTEFPCKYIPVIPVIGNEFWYDDKRHLDGMVKWGKDGQLAYNYARSSDVEVISLAPKVPFIGAKGQFDGQETKWASANRANVPYLEYNPVDINGTTLPAPQRQQPPIASGWQSIAGIAASDIEASLGMYKASIGAPGNERSGAALRARRSESDTGSFHYTDNLSISVAHAGRIIVDTLPYFLDTQRAIPLLTEEGKTSVAYVNPQLNGSYSQAPDDKRIFNPLVGKYEAAVDAGPAYSTKREESAAAMVELARGSPELIKIIGDLMIRAMDWPGADKIADRLQALLPPAVQSLEAQGNDVNAMRAKLLMATQTMQQQQQVIQQMQQQLQQLATEAQGKAAKHAVDSYEAETNRMKVIGPMLSPQDVQQIVLSTLQSLLTVPDISPVQPGPLPQPGGVPVGLFPGNGGAEPQLPGGPMAG